MLLGLLAAGPPGAGRRERPPLKCTVCATFFFPRRRADAKYCSNLCRQLAYRQRSG